jgi:hypothetical protein
MAKPGSATKEAVYKACDDIWEQTGILPRNKDLRLLFHNASQNTLTTHLAGWIEANKDRISIPRVQPPLSLMADIQDRVNNIAVEFWSTATLEATKTLKDEAIDYQSKLIDSLNNELELTKIDCAKWKTLAEERKEVNDTLQTKLDDLNQQIRSFKDEAEKAKDDCISMQKTMLNLMRLSEESNEGVIENLSYLLNNPDLINQVKKPSRQQKQLKGV